MVHLYRSTRHGGRVLGYLGNTFSLGVFLTNGYTVEPPQLFFNEVTGFETSSRLLLLSMEALPTPTSSFDGPLQTTRKCVVKIFFVIASVLVSRSRLENYCWRKSLVFGGGAIIVESV